MTSTPSAQNLISPTPSCLAVMMFAVICSMSGCSSEPVAEVDGGAAVIADGGATAGVTYADVAPVFERYCVSCHSPGGVGPMELTTYEGAKA